MTFLHRPIGLGEGGMTFVVISGVESVGQYDRLSSRYVSGSFLRWVKKSSGGGGWVNRVQASDT